MKLKKEFNDFIKEITIDSEVEDLIEKRETLQNDFKNKFPIKCSEHDIDIKKSDIEFFDQGSYKLHTTIKNKYGSIDRDIAVMFPLDIDINDDPRKIKGYAKDALSTGIRTVTVKEPCVNVSYLENDEEWLHIDMPLYAKYNGNVYLARGRATSQNYEWEEADPKGLNDYLLNEINNNAPLRRVIRYLKKWKLEEYHNSTNDNEIPPSIGITLLACDSFINCTENGSDYDLLSLLKTMERIQSKFELTYENGNLVKAEITRKLPTVPDTDVFSKMKNSSDVNGVKFYNKLSRAIQNLKDAYNAESEHDAGKSVQKVLGDEFIVPEKETSFSKTSIKKEHSFG